MKKRVAILYHNNFGRNDGPPLYYLHNLQKIEDFEVVHLIPDGDEIANGKFGKFDYHFWIDYGEDGLPVDHEWKIPKDGGKTIYVASDAHVDDGYRLKKAEQFDYVFFNQLEAAGRFNQQDNGKIALWLPHAAEPDAYPHTEQIKKYDVCFIGHFQDTINHNGFTRVDMLDRAFKEFPNFYFGTRSPQKPELNMFEDAAKKFNQSKVVLNISIKDDINMRFFEVLCAGGFLLTNNLPTLKDLEGLEDGKHYVTYNTLDEMVEKAKYYLEHDEEREAIAKAGHVAFMQGHTYMHRIKRILDIIETSS